MIDLYTYCIQCGKRLTNDEIGLYKKMVNRGATDFLCIDCLSAHFGITVEKALEIIEQYRRNGCTLFAKKDQ